MYSCGVYVYRAEPEIICNIIPSQRKTASEVEEECVCLSVCVRVCLFVCCVCACMCRTVGMVGCKGQ